MSVCLFSVYSVWIHRSAGSVSAQHRTATALPVHRVHCPVRSERTALRYELVTRTMASMREEESELNHKGKNILTKRTYV